MVSFLRSSISLCISKKHCLTKACTSAVLCACLLDRSWLRLPISPFTCSATWSAIEGTMIREAMSGKHYARRRYGLTIDGHPCVLLP